MRLPGIDEEVERIECFDELHVGMIVWDTPCLQCTGRHRALLTVAHVGGMVVPLSVAFGLLPSAPCIEESVISSRSVDAGRIYRVVDPTMDAERDTIVRVKKLAVRT